MDLWDRSKSVDDYLSLRARLHAMVPPLTVEEPLTGALRPRNFALLLFGREPERFFDGAFALLSRYPGPDRDTSFTDEDRRLLQSTLDEIRAQIGSLTGSRDD